MLLFDVETDGFLEPTPEQPRAMTKIHCVVIQEGTKIARYHEDPTLPRDGNLAAGLQRLENAPKVGAHGLSTFDLHAVRRVHPSFRAKAELGVTDIDTITVGRTVYPDEYLKEADQARPKFQKELVGRHSIEAWGQRLKAPKLEKPATFETMDAAMLAYCVRDTEVLGRLWAHLLQHEPTPFQVKLEHRFAQTIAAMERRGCAFDSVHAQEITGRLLGRRAELDDQLRASFPDFVEEYVTPVRQEHKTRIITFNPNSRQHIARALTEKYRWVPEAYTDSGQVKIDETIVSTLPFPEAKVIEERLMLKMRLGSLSEGEYAYLKLVKPNGRIHGVCRHNAARTSRCVHSSPNMANITGVDEPWGTDLRSCFVAAPGMVLVDADATNIEARIMAHYASAVDGGELAKVIMDGDVHSVNAAALECSRPQAKIFFYALLYGAGDGKLGRILGGTAADGARGRKRLMSRVPGIGKVMYIVEAQAKACGRIPTLDGRKLWTDKRKAYNTLIQGGASIVMKLAVVLAAPKIEALGGGMVMFIHDELVIECPPEVADQVGQAATWAVEEAGRLIGIRVPLGGNYKVGANFAVGH